MSRTTTTLATAHEAVKPTLPAELVSVPFREGFILAARLDDDVFVPVRPVCEALCVSVEGQLAKLKSKPWATLKMIFTVADDGRARQHAAVDLRSLPMWLATIEPSRVKPDARPALLSYQLDAADVLARHFLAPPSPVAGDDLAERVRRLEGEVAELQGRGRQRGRLLASVLAILEGGEGCDGRVNRWWTGERGPRWPDERDVNSFLRPCNIVSYTSKRDTYGQANGLPPDRC